MFDANLIIPAQISDELSHGQAEFPKILRSKFLSSDKVLHARQQAHSKNRYMIIQRIVCDVFAWLEI